MAPAYKNFFSSIVVKTTYVGGNSKEIGNTPLGKKIWPDGWDFEETSGAKVAHDRFNHGFFAGKTQPWVQSEVESGRVHYRSLPDKALPPGAPEANYIDFMSSDFTSMNNPDVFSDFRRSSKVLALGQAAQAVIESTGNGASPDFSSVDLTLMFNGKEYTTGVCYTEACKEFKPWDGAGNSLLSGGRLPSLTTIAEIWKAFDSCQDNFSVELATKGSVQKEVVLTEKLSHDMRKSSNVVSLLCVRPLLLIVSLSLVLQPSFCAAVSVLHSA
jgi:hypothetical protein